MVEQTIIKEVKDLAICAREVLSVIIQMDKSNGIPNTAMFTNDQVQFNIQMGGQCNNLIMNFSIYICGINNYLLNLISMFPQDDYFYPEGTDEDTKLFKIRGVPLLGAHNLEKPIVALSIEEAVESALEYVYDNIENIIGETIGASGI